MHSLSAMLLACLLLTTPASAQDEPAAAPAEPEVVTLRVATKPFAPFVVTEGDAYAGFSIELWEHIADELGVQTEWVGTTSVGELLETIEEPPTADIAMAGITITSAREQSVDFSHPFFHTGLQVLVNTSQGATPVALIKTLFNPALFKAILGLLFFLLAAAHALWFFERKHNDMFPKAYAKGIWEAFWWSAVTVTTVGYGDKTPKSVPGRMIAVVWMFSGLLFLGYFTASIATVLTINQLTGSISSAEDLVGRQVGTVAGTTAADYLESQGARLVEFDAIDDAFQALDKKEIDAVVYDAPVLRYYAAHEGLGRARVVGAIFKEQSYGVAMPTGSPHREPVSRALLTLRENGVYDGLYAEYFGE